MAKKPTVADLMAEIEALKREVAELKARPAQVHYHWPASQPWYVGQPNTVPLSPSWPPGITCSTAGTAG
jgi:hypothetical protein